MKKERGVGGEREREKERERERGVKLYFIMLCKARL